MKLLSRLALAALLALPLAAQAQGYPNKPIKMIIPLAAGSAVDNAARVVTQKMGETLGQGFAVENIAGAAGVTGAERLARSAPDGYTIGGFNDSVLTMVPHLVPKMPWNALTDFVPVSLVGTIEWGLVVKAESPYRTLADFLAAAKAAPGKLNYGSGGVGSSQHLAGAMFKARTGVDILHIPYKGSGPAVIAMLGNEVSFMFDSISTSFPQVKAGKLKAVAVSSLERASILPNTPTIAETLPGFDVTVWYGILAPAGTSDAVIGKLSQAFAEVGADPKIRSQLAESGYAMVGSTPAAFGKHIEAELTKWSKAVKDSGATIQ